VVSNKHIIEEIVRLVGYLPELYEDARSEKYEILWSEMHVALVCSKLTVWRMLVRTYLDVLCHFMKNYIYGVATCCAVPWELFILW